MPRNRIYNMARYRTISGSNNYTEFYEGPIA